MNQASEPNVSQPDPVAGGWRRRLRFEMILNGVLLLCGIILVPIAVYFTGQELLGQYSTEGKGLLDLYGSILKDMGRGHLAAWGVVLSPLLGITLLRALWLPLRRRPQPETAPEKM
ncbi:MAG: hypothetical protein WBN65_13580 [Gammaproteobacteria bacterium]